MGFTLYLLGFLVLSIGIQYLSVQSLALPLWSAATVRSQFRTPSLVTSTATSGFIFDFWIHSSLVRGEGFVVPMANERADPGYLTFPVSAKLHGVEPRKTSESNQTKQRKTETAKRSFKRALLRTRTHGFTWYRGRLVTARQMGTSVLPTPTTSMTPNVAPPTRKLRTRLTCATWNCGGLNPAGWDQLQLWLRNQTIDVMFVQETHWGYTSEWSQDRFHVIHCGFSNKQAGVLCLVAKSVCSAQSISWQSIADGRILHVRIHGQHRSMDLINVYQVPFHPNSLADRDVIWNKLSDLLTQLPRRNTLFLAGDFNTSLTSRSDAVGVAAYQWKGQRCKGSAQSDEFRLRQIFTTYDLCALNTWDHSHGPTYVFEHQHSRVDFLCCRRAHSDATSRNVQQLDDFPLLPLSGSFHIPLLTSIRKQWHTGQVQPGHGWTHAQRMTLHRHFLQNDAVFNDMRTFVEASVQQLDSTGTASLQDLHAVMGQVDGKAFDKIRAAPVYQQNFQPFKQFQLHTLALRKLTFVDQGSVFRAWHHLLQRCKARRLMNATAKQSRKLRLQQIYDRATQAERSKDHFGIYQAVRELCPKQPMKRVMLRDAQGRLLGPAESADFIQQWYQALFTRDKSSFHACSFTWPFDMDDLDRGFASLPSQKALAPVYGPATLWKSSSSTIAKFVHPLAQQHSCMAHFPSCWSTGHLTFLIKPQKRGAHPKELRPIALLEPSGKVLMGMVAERLKVELGPRLESVPQFAYLQDRSTEDAIHRVVHHICMVQDSLHSFSYPVHQKAQGVRLPTLCGGLMLSLDMTRAFDSIDRHKLFQSLVRLGASFEIRQLLMGVYAQTSYHFVHRGESRAFRTDLGIRQGCKAAPILWTAFVTDLIMQLSDLTTWSWVSQCLTVFADDFIVHQAFDCEEAFVTLMRRVGLLFDLLAETGLELNTAKTVAALRLKGEKLQKIMKRYVLRTQHGTFLLVPRKSGTPTKILLVRKFKYLGVSLSYYNFQQDTMNWRLQSSALTSQQLHRWLHTRNLTAAQRARVWYQCVMTCARYGLLSVGFTSHTLMQFFRFCMKQLRRIFRDPVHLSKLSHVDFLYKHRLRDPLHLLLDFAEKAEARHYDRICRLHASDILLSAPLSKLSTWIQVIRATIEQRDTITLEEAMSTLFTCHICDRTFSSLSTLRRHLTIHHDQPSGLLRVESSEVQTVTPTCPRCRQKFSSWHGLQYHRQYVCMAPAQDEDLTEHNLRTHELLQFAHVHQLMDIRQHPSLVAFFQNHCALCGKFLNSTKGMLSHWNCDHTSMYAQHHTAFDFYHTQLDLGNPCCLCTTNYVQYHHCLVLRQLAMLITDRQLVHHYCQVQPSPQLQCHFCMKAFSTKHGLAQHIRRFHNVIKAGESDNLDHIEYRCLIHEAVTNNRCTDILEHEELLEFLGRRCLECTLEFSHRSYLMRHMRQTHAHFWNDMMNMAKDLQEEFRSPLTCFCRPPQHRHKHLCTVFLQFSLLRLTTDRAEDPAELLSLPPDQMASTVDRVEQLLWHGHSRLIYKFPALKLALSKYCQCCGLDFSTDALLLAHLQADHAELLQECGAMIRLLQWHLFQSHGCMCNPVHPWNTPDHCCVSIIQTALIGHMAKWPILIPWPFRTNELLAPLGDVLPQPAFERIAKRLMSRQFESIWFDSDLLQLLRTRCVLCGDVTTLSAVTAHLNVHHMFTPLVATEILQPLCVIYGQVHSDDPSCDHCGVRLPSELGDTDWIPQPEKHLMKCPLLLHMAALLMHPVVHQLPFVEGTWPTRQQMESAHQQQELQRELCNVQTSDIADTTFEPWMACGKQILADTFMSADLNNQCLLCLKRFFMPQNFIAHLKDHDHKQLQTLRCIMGLFSSMSPCDFCGSEKHTFPTQCTALLNLATFLANGSPIRSSANGLEGHPGYEPVGRARAPKGACRTGFQTAAQKGPKQISLQRLFGRQADRDHEAGGTTAASTRGHVTCPDYGARVCSPPPSGGCVSAPAASQADPGISERGFHGVSETHTGSPDGGNGAGETRETSPGTSGGILVQSLLGNQPDQCRSHHAVPLLVPQEHEDAAQQGQVHADRRGSPQLSEHSEDYETGRRDHLEISQSHQDEGRGSQSDTISVDSSEPQQRGTLASPEGIVLPQFLAAWPSFLTAAEPTEVGARKAIAAAIVDGAECHVLRVLLNPTGTLCYANSVVLALGWLTLLTDNLDPACWIHGYQFFKSLTSWTHQPLCLRDCEPFRWLLCGGWSERELLTQQDATDFCHYILEHTKPSFMSGSWTTRVQFQEGAADSHLAFENNSRFAPIMLSIIDSAATHGSLVDLIATWHNPEGLCRAIDEVGDGVVLMIDRNLPDISGKCLQRVDFGNDSVHLPAFSAVTGDIHYIEYHVCAVCHHIGPSPLSGHYRTLLRYHGYWLHYDDNQLPEVLEQIPESVLRTCTLLWLAHSDFEPVRTMAPSLPRRVQPRSLPMPLLEEARALEGLNAPGPSGLSLAADMDRSTEILQGSNAAVVTTDSDSTTVIVSAVTEAEKDAELDQMMTVSNSETMPASKRAKLTPTLTDVPVREVPTNASPEPSNMVAAAAAP